MKATTPPTTSESFAIRGCPSPLAGRKRAGPPVGERNVIRVRVSASRPSRTTSAGIFRGDEIAVMRLIGRSNPHITKVVHDHVHAHRHE
jgi:hypothetical protein